MSKERRVHPECRNAPNPYHECSEFCFDIIADAKALTDKKNSASEIAQASVDCSCSISGTAVEVTIPKEVAEELSQSANDPLEVVDEGDISKHTGRKKRLFKLRLKMNEARKANQTAMVAEKKKMEAPTESRGVSKQKWLEDRKKKLGRLLDANGLEMSKAYILDTQEMAESKHKKWEKDPAPHGWDVFNQKALYNAYKKRATNIEVDLDEYNKMKEADAEFYREATSLQYGKAPKLSEEKVDKMVKELKDREEKCKSFSRRRRFHEEKDIDSINDRNEHFNKKIERAFGKYILEIKNNFCPTEVEVGRYFLQVISTSNKKTASDIPTPQFLVVDTYERDYSRSFIQPTSYLRGRGALAELGEFVEYDLDNEDEDWLHEFNKGQIDLSHKRFEGLLFRLEVLDHKAREKAGIVTPTLGSPIPVLLQLEAAVEALQASQVKYAVLESVYSYWKEKRARWQKPILRRLQPPPPVNDTNPYNVFRPREKAHRLHTRRMQRRENNVQSFEKLRQVRRNLEQAKIILGALIKREERKRDVMENEVGLQRFQLTFKQEIDLVEDGMALPGIQPLSFKVGSSEEELIYSDDIASYRPVSRPSAQTITQSNVHGVTVKLDFKLRYMHNQWLYRVDVIEPILLFTKPLVPEKLAAAGIIPPSNVSARIPFSRKFHGRIGRGGRIIFDRWTHPLHHPIKFGSSV